MSSTATLVVFGGFFLGLLLLAPGRVGERLHAWAFGLVIWILQRPFVALAGLGKAIVAMVGQEVARYLAIAMSGLLVTALAWLVVTYLPAAVPGYEVILLCVALLGMIWFLAVIRAIKLTLENRLWRVRQQQFFKKVAAEAEGTRQAVDKLQAGGGRIVEGTARLARGTPFGGVFRANRDTARQAEADAQEAAERAEVQRREAQRQAEADRLAKEERDRYLERVGAEHDPFERQGG